jgi:hypothetical protein
MTMFGVLQRYDPKQGAADEFIGHVKTSVVPLVANVPGFVSHRILNLRPDVLLSISTFVDKSGAEEWARRASDALGPEPRALLAISPTIVVGRVHDRRRSPPESSSTDPVQAAAEGS